MERKEQPVSAILLIHCPDQKGLVARVTSYIYQRGGNILDIGQHVDQDADVFLMRVEWVLEGFSLARSEIADDFAREIAEPCRMEWSLHFSDDWCRVGILVSKLSHCLYDLLARMRSEQWRVVVPAIVSNHEELSPVAGQFGIPFFHVPVLGESKAQAEEALRGLVDKERLELLVLARYMQILSPDFVAACPRRIINIHHSFLPAFPGAKPYHSAHERGVKIIGATSHYVTDELDAGPIIEQDVVRVSHGDTIGDLVRKGQDLEKIVLSRAVRWHLERKVIVYGNKTVIFD